jgi:hypothetical protein
LPPRPGFRRPRRTGGHWTHPCPNLWRIPPGLASGISAAAKRLKFRIISLVRTAPSPAQSIPSRRGCAAGPHPTPPFHAHFSQNEGGAPSGAPPANPDPVRALRRRPSAPYKTPPSPPAKAG